jgi:hypothetical protein
VTIDRASADLRIPLAFAGVVLFGGLNIVAVKFSNQDSPPFFGAGLRFALAGTVFLAIAVIGKIPFPRGRALLGSVLYGIYGFVLAFGLVYWALQTLPASIAGVIVAAVPLFTLLLAAVQGLEPFRWRGLAGGALAVAGIAVLVGTPQDISVPLLPVLAVAAAALALSQAAIVIKKYPPCHPVATNVIALAIGAAALIPLSLLRGEDWWSRRARRGLRRDPDRRGATGTRGPRPGGAGLTLLDHLTAGRTTALLFAWPEERPGRPLSVVERFRLIEQQHSHRCFHRRGLMATVQVIGGRLGAQRRLDPPPGGTDQAKPRDDCQSHRKQHGLGGGEKDRRHQESP